jgi:hypothetical protein
MAENASKSEHRNEPHFLSWLLTNPITLLLAGFIALLTVFYVEEDLRGKIAWQRYRHQFQASGHVLDWNAFVPAHIPDAENIFAAPKMRDWFVRGGSEDLTRRMNASPLSKYLKQNAPTTVAELFIVPPDSTNPLPKADIVLRFDFPILSLASDASTTPTNDPASVIIPLIVMDTVPLADAIRNLAHQGNLKYAFTADVAAEYVPHGKPQPSVTLRWENVTARHALTSLLANYGLSLVENHKTGVALITKDDPYHTQPRVYMDSDARERMGELIRQAIRTNNGPYANGAQGYKLVARADKVRPFRILLLTTQKPSPAELKQFFPADAIQTIRSPFDQPVESNGTNSFRFLLTLNQIAAADYLAWNNQFAPDFDHIREALKRPCARIDGNYSQPASIPMINFVVIRVLAQTIGQRAQCYLLLNDPGNAVRELALLHDMNRLLENKPITLVAAMIETAITGIYMDVVADGFRLGVWREPQLAALQEQLKEVNLPPLLRSAFVTERASICWMLENQNAASLRQALAFPPTSQSFWQRFQDPKALLVSLAPHGWSHQNMIMITKINQDYLDSFDADRQIFYPRRLDSSLRAIQTNFSRLNPQNFLAAMTVPNFNRACQTLAHNQTLANEAFIACALERYRLTRGQFPENLDRLTPAFAQKLPADVINGAPLHYFRKGPDHFLLYSVSWNETDDGGVAIRNKSGYLSFDEGDWPWDPLQDRK